MHLLARRFVWPLATLLAMSWPLSSANAQSLLPPGIANVTGPFNDEQRQAVDQHIARWASQLTADVEADVAEARANLVAPLRGAGSTQSFKTQYSVMLAPRLAQGVASQRVIVRLNTMIVAAHLVGTGGLEILQPALADQVGSIRYWAAKGIAQSLADQPDIADQDAQNIVNALKRRLAAESSSAIREQLYLALASLNSKPSRAALIEAIDERIEVYAQAGLTEDIRAEQEALSRLYTALVTTFLQNNAERTEVSELATVCARYVQLVKDQSAQGGIPQELSPIVIKLIRDAEIAMNWGLQVYDPGTPNGPELEAPLRAGNEQQFRLNVLDWVELLKTSKIRIPAQDLQIPAAASAVAN